MKTYPHILNSSRAPRKDCYVFVKYGGSNLRFEWSRKRGWYKYGTREELFDASSPIYGEAIQIFEDYYADALPAVFGTREYRDIRSFTVFCEYFGSKSFAGTHVLGDAKELILFDVYSPDTGFIGPKAFMSDFGHLRIAEWLDLRKMGPELIHDVRTGRLGYGSSYFIRTAVQEGVVCKGASGNNPWMCKIKTDAYRDTLKAYKPDSWNSLWE